MYGRIEGIAWVADACRALQERNAAVLGPLPATDDRPALIAGMFAVPAPPPLGTFRQQVIHFGASFEDEPGDPRVWAGWVGKFEGLLRQLYWLWAVVHLETEFRPRQTWRWDPTDGAPARLASDDPPPVEAGVRVDPPQSPVGRP